MAALASSAARCASANLKIGWIGHEKMSGACFRNFEKSIVIEVTEIIWTLNSYLAASASAAACNSAAASASSDALRSNSACLSDAAKKQENVI